MRPAAPISRGVLSDQVKDRLLQAILAGEYPAGSRIVETRVARDLGVSQAPVREALRDLEVLGVVEIRAFQGARVCQPGTTELLEAYDIRSVLESLGARLALSKLTDEDLAELARLVEKMEEAAAAGDRHAEATADAAFHTRIIETAGNRTLERVWRHLEPVSRTYITLLAPGVNVQQIADLHRPILEALRQRDSSSTDEAIRAHFAAVGAMFETALAGRSAAAEARTPARDGTAATGSLAASAVALEA